MTEAIDLAWVLVCAVLVMAMQAGFLCLETGLTRSKNAINVAMKNLADLGLSVLGYWLVGFWLMFGASNAGIVGGDHFALDLASADGATGAFFLFQALFCGTAVTIMSGAVAGRMRFGGYLLLAGVTSMVLYPVLGHWIWQDDGWLADIGFVDFAGATVVHSVGGWAGLAVILVLGPRLGRFAEGAPRSVAGANLPFATLGALLLWVGWIGFNGGSLYRFGDDVVGVLINTIIAGAAGVVVGAGLGWWRWGMPEVAPTINGLLAGLVAVTASADLVTTAEAVLIGAVGAGAMFAVDALLLRRRIDDAVGAVPVHLGAGVWGTLAVALFADLESIGVERSTVGQLALQVLGVVVAGVWVFGLTYLFARAVDAVWPLRVSVEDEEVGLNVAEHGAVTDLVDLFRSMEAQVVTGDAGLRVPESEFTEVGQIGRQFNRVLDSLESTNDALQASEDEARHDELTSTLNRRGLTLHLDDRDGVPVTVLMFDVVRFGSINGSLGYSAGDEVLVAIADTLRARLGPDWAFGRWGGDEFVAVAEGDVEIEPAMLERIPCRLRSGGQVTVSVRLGMVQADGELSGDEVIRQASYALDDTKRSGATLAAFDARLARRYERSKELAASLGGSLAQSGIVAVAQTIVRDGVAIGAELLARWRNDDGSLAPPSDFLPVLVENGLIGELDLHMLDEGAAFAARFNNRVDAPWASVNVSAPTLAMQGFVEHVAAALARHRLPPERLVIEITETEHAGPLEQWLPSARRVRELGVGLAIDDFGSGYSGLQRMSVVPITHVKLDRELVQAVSGPIGGVVRSVADYAASAGIIAVAEGVETDDQRLAMQALGVEVMQGFLFSRPETLDDVEHSILESLLSDAAAPVDRDVLD